MHLKPLQTPFRKLSLVPQQLRVKNDEDIFDDGFGNLSYLMVHLLILATY